MIRWQFIRSPTLLPHSDRQFLYRKLWFREFLGAALYKVWTTRDYPNISQGSVCRVEQSIAVPSAHQQILRELLTLDTASSAGLHREARVQETRQDLHGIQFTVSVQRKPDHLPTIQLVPGNSAPWLKDGLCRLWKQFIDQCSVGTQHNPFAEIRWDVQCNHLVHFDVGGRGRDLALTM